MINVADLIEGTRVRVLPKASDRVSVPWVVTVRDVILPSRESNGGVWTMDYQWVPAHRIDAVV